MNIVYFLIPMALLLGGSFLTAFIIATKKGQFDDLDTPASRMLLDDKETLK
ncbi:MAG: cbb3-type cytochrome oxidase assembly protein CcoS [Bacteriovoracia bacterium]